MAAQSAYVEVIKLLLKNPKNKADPNIPTREGLSAFHILLARLIDLANLENKSSEQRGPKPLSDEDLDEEIIRCCLFAQVKNFVIRLKSTESTFELQI